MKPIVRQVFLILAAMCLGSAAIAGEIKPVETAAAGERLVIAEVHDGVLVPMLSDAEIKNLLEDAMMASSDQELQVWLEKVWFEKNGESHYLMAVAENVSGEKLSSAIKLEEVGITANTSAVGIPVPVAVIPICKSISCTNDPCPMRVWPEHIECYCIAAGECELKWRVILIGVGEATGF